MTDLTHPLPATSWGNNRRCRKLEQEVFELEKRIATLLAKLQSVTRPLPPVPTEAMRLLIAQRDELQAENNMYRAFLTKQAILVLKNYDKRE